MVLMLLLQRSLGWLMLLLMVGGAHSTTVIEPYSTDAKLSTTTTTASASATTQDPNNNNNVDESPIQPRIINGDDAPRDRYSWIARYSFNGQTESCGGSLIAPDIVLTNAHCWTDGAPDLGIAIIGTLLRTEREPQFEVVERIPHPEYIPKEDGVFNPYYDVAIIKLKDVLDGLQTIQLNFDPEVPSVYQELTVLGWGSVKDAPYEFSNSLKEATTQYIPFAECAVASDPETGMAYGTSPTNTGVGPDWLCSSDPIGAICKGDSGGPVIRAGVNPRSDLLVGVISATAGGCENRNLPQINQRVSFHRDWIVSNVCALSENPPAEFGCPNSSPISTPINTTPAPTTAPPTVSPTPKPTTRPPVTPAPTTPPTLAPVPAPTAAPVPIPTIRPSRAPNPVPTSAPTSSAALDPTSLPSPVPTGSMEPTLSPAPVEEGVPQPDGGEREDVTTIQPVSVAIESPTSSPNGDNGDDRPTSSPAPTSNEVTVHIKIILDENPQHIGWMIADENYARFRVAVPMGAYLPGDEVVNDRVAVVGGEGYMFVISDFAGDGLSAGGGSYEVFLGEEFGFEVLAEGSGNFGESEATTFVVPCAIGVTCSPTEEQTRAPNAPPAPTRAPNAAPQVPTTKAPNAPTPSPATPSGGALPSAEPTTPAPVGVSTPTPPTRAPTSTGTSPTPIPTRAPTTRAPTLRPTPQSAAGDTHQRKGFCWLVFLLVSGLLPIIIL